MNSSRLNSVIGEAVEKDTVKKKRKCQRGIGEEQSANGQAVLIVMGLVVLDGVQSALDGFECLYWVSMGVNTPLDHFALS